ncbi:MAG: divergent polysaccharide deacetylase family protein [Candidatus Gorgyraea atricola]|nr:divergent polysaccharide deacetylase family protein [Candidatus Gorgyraea atricola]
MKKRVFIIVLVVILGLSFTLYRAMRPKGLVAFVIDDWGYNKRNIDLVLEINRPLTISILPNLRYSSYVAEEIRKNSKIHDIILHLPLESKSGMAAEIDTIRSSMAEDRIVSILEKDIESIPGVIGVSNHQGSKATRDKKIMSIVLSELEKRKLFFLDSLTAPDSACSYLAHEVGLKCAVRDVFLDITDQTDLANFETYIRKQIRELAAIALEKRSAIGVGHNKKITLNAIKDAIPELEKQGIKIVPLKTLAR